MRRGVVPCDCEGLGVGGAILDVAIEGERCSTVAPSQKCGSDRRDAALLPCIG
jgi:hypothetical protein